MKFTEQNPQELKALIAKYNDLYKECAISHLLLIEPYMLKIGDQVLGNVRYNHDSISTWLSSNNTCPMGSTKVKITGENIFLDAEGTAIINEILENLENAIKENDVAEIKAWLQAGGDVDQLLPDGSSLINKAFLFRKVDIIKVLIENKADVNKFVLEGKSQYLTPLHIAAFIGDTDVAGILLDNGADLNQIIKDGANKGLSALFCALDKEKLQFVKLLLDRGVDVNQFVKDGRHVGLFPLSFAAARRNTDAVKLLIERGADANHIIQSGKSYGLFPLYLAAAVGYAEVIEILINNGANPNQFVADGDNKGAFPLYIAAQNGQIDAIKALVAKGAKVNAIAGDGGLKGRSSLYIAADNKHGDTVKLLIELGAYDIENDFTQIKDISPELLEIINQANVLYNQILKIATEAFKMPLEKLPFIKQSEYLPREKHGVNLLKASLYSQRSKVKEIIDLGDINKLTQALSESALTSLDKVAVSQILDNMLEYSSEETDSYSYYSDSSSNDSVPVIFSGAVAAAVVTPITFQAAHHKNKFRKFLCG